TGRDFHLAAGSPAIDKGDPSYSAAAGETDFDGKPRVQGGRIDAGAFESGDAPATTTPTTTTPGTTTPPATTPPTTTPPNGGPPPRNPSRTPGISGAPGESHATLHEGASGDDVKALQEALTKAGFATDADGDFGPKTLDAVKRFQRAKGLA